MATTSPPPAPVLLVTWQRAISASVTAPVSRMQTASGPGTAPSPQVKAPVSTAVSCTPGIKPHWKSTAVTSPVLAPMPKMKIIATRNNLTILVPAGIMNKCF